MPLVNHHMLFLFRSVSKDAPPKFIFEEYSTNKKTLEATISRWRSGVLDITGEKVVKDKDYKIVTVRGQATDIKALTKKTERELNIPKGSAWTVYKNDLFESVQFKSSNDACEYCAKDYALHMGLPKGKYHLQWDIALKDERQRTRVYVEKTGTYQVVADHLED